MPTWLSDPSRSLYIVLALVGVLAVLAAVFLFRPAPNRRDSREKQTSPRIYFIGVGAIALALLAGLFVCDRLFESDREQIERKLHEMSAAVHQRDAGKIFEHVSETFRKGSADKKSLRTLAEHALSSGQVAEIPIWDISVEPVGPTDAKANVRFQFKAKGSALKDEAQFIAKALFVRDPDGQWRLQTFDVFIPPNERDSIPIPGL